MSYGFPEQEPPRRGGCGGCGGLMFLILIGIGIYLFMNMQRPAQVPDREADKYSIKEGLFEPENRRPDLNGNPEADKYRIKEGVFDPESRNPPAAPSQPMPNGRSQNDGDWSMTEVEVRPQSSMPSSSPENKTTRNGDWSIQEVDGDGNSAATTPKEQPRFQFSTPSNGDSAVPSAPTKTTEGDWSIEETE